MNATALQESTGSLEESLATNGAPTKNPADPRAEALRLAVQWYGRKNVDWTTFFREVLGVGGVVRSLFSTPEQLAEFEQTEQYAEIQQMMARLRQKPAATTEEKDKEPTRVITVRLPKSLHEWLREEAAQKATSMNQLCITKLLRVIDNEPAE